MVAHFHADRERLQRLPGPRGRISEEGAAATLRNEGEMAGASKGRANGALEQAEHSGDDRIAFAVAWRFKGSVGATQHVGVTHLMDCSFPVIGRLPRHLLHVMNPAVLQQI